MVSLEVMLSHCLALLLDRADRPDSSLCYITRAGATTFSSQRTEILFAMHPFCGEGSES